MDRGSPLSSLRRLTWLALFATSFAGCAASPALRAAENGNLAALRSAIADATKRGDLDGDEARKIALAVASMEVERAGGPTGAERIRELEPCARELEDALEERASGVDDIAAVASFVLLDAGLEDPEDIGPRASSAERGAAAPQVTSAWRAVRARALVLPSQTAERRALILDGDQEVRVAALRAAIDAAEPADTGALFEAARLDPYPIARTMAIRALGVIGGERVVLALKDLWPLADEPRRQGIVVAWSLPPSLATGGRRELTWAVDTTHGPPAIAAALALTRAGGAGSPGPIGVLARSIAEGPTRDRVYAINVAPLGVELLRRAIQKAQDDPDEAVAIAAIARRVEASGEGRALDGSKERAALIARLLKSASSDSSLALIAKGALARAGVREVIPILERDSKSRSASAREVAGALLASMGELPRAAPLVADPEPQVRATVACAILRAPR